MQGIPELNTFWKNRLKDNIDICEYLGNEIKFLKFMNESLWEFTRAQFLKKVDLEAMCDFIKSQKKTSSK